MNELKRIAADIESAFDASGYPREFLAAFDQLECLASHAGRETFLVQPKGGGALAVATCYDRTVLPFHPDIGLLQGLEHPGLPRYLAVYQNDQTLCVVRSYIEGSTLADWAGERQLGLQEIAALGVKLCDILEALHTHVPPVVHRDIKPENIIVRPDGSLALIDLDIARAVRGDAGSDTVCFGTRGYAPPEQYGFGQTDPRSDIYALGVLLRWLVTGSTRLNANIAFDPALTHIIARCTAFSPSDRYADIGQVRRALMGVGRRRLRVRPRALVLGLLAALMLLCAGFAAGRYTNWFRPVEKLTFEEPLIERAARLWIGKERGPLTPEDLAQVTRLYIYGTEAFGDPEPFYQCSIDRSVVGPIRTLDDLSRLPNLEEVHIVHQGYVDAAGIAGMPKLRTVELKHLRLSGAAPVADAPSLRNVVLFSDGLTDVTVLQNCPWLEELDIGLNDITSLSQVGSHPNVKTLGLMWLELPDLNDIAQRMPKLQAITLQHSQIGDLSGLKDLPNLKVVYVLPEQLEAVQALFEGTDVTIKVTEN